MQIRAENDPRYSRKFLIMGLVAIGFAIWSLRDGLVAYPAQREQGFADFKTEDTKYFSDADRKALSLGEFEATADEQQRTKWSRYVVARDIPAEANIITQFVMAAIAAPVGLWLISMPLRARGRWIEIGDAGVTSSWGQNFRFDQVELVNKRKWRNKGIAKVTYRDDNNRKRVFVVDDYKFERYPTDAILYELEQRIDPERIANGPPEPHPEGPVEEIISAGKQNEPDAAS
jgi:hypothetical protein